MVSGVGGGRADICPALGSWVVRLGKGKMGLRRWQRVGCGFGGCLGHGAILGTGLPCRILSGFGLREGMGYWAMVGGILAGSVAALRGEMK